MQTVTQRNEVGEKPSREFLAWLWNTKGLTKSHYDDMHWRDQEIWQRAFQNDAPAKPGMFPSWKDFWFVARWGVGILLCVLALIISSGEWR